MALFYIFINSSLSAGFMLAVIVAAVWDARVMRIPNSSVLAIAALFTLKATLFLSLSSIGSHLLLAMVFLTGGLCLWLPGWFGGGDVKLVAAVALWIGPQDVAGFMLALSLTTVVLAGSFLLIRRYSLVGNGHGLLAQANRMARNGTCPYALAIAPAAFLFA